MQVSGFHELYLQLVYMYQWKLRRRFVSFLVCTQDKSHLREHQHSWVEEAYADAAYKVWQVRYVFSEGLRNIRSYLPSELFLTKKLHYWEDALAGPTE